jgi:hypothetical protein
VVEIGFSDGELDAIERTHPRGLPSESIDGLLQSRGIKLTEATLRKWVQLGLLPRSRRVGMPGGHPGSIGLYPASVVRRIQRLRTMMKQHTIEEIKHRGLGVRADVAELEACLARIFVTLEGSEAVREAERLGTELVAKLAGIEARQAVRA